MSRWTSKSHGISPESERTLKVDIYPEERNILRSKKEISLQMWGTARERGEIPAPGWMQQRPCGFVV